ncbi:MAG: BatD family protein [Proteobacteria bacterium]|nr:BatD family protein [Pseudomonadota bacterium]
MKSLFRMFALLAVCVMMSAQAAVRASLDRDHVAPGESVTLTISADGSGAQPDLSPLRNDFSVDGVSSGSQTTIINGAVQSSQQWSVTLTPRHGGVIAIPALKVGANSTAPLRLLVDGSPATSAASPSNPQDNGAPDASLARGPSKPGDPVFIADDLAPAKPYVGQALVYTLRLYYAVNLLDAALDPPTTDNGDLRQIGQDQRDMQTVDGRRYLRLTRRYLLQPERSGALHLQAPAFRGRAIANPGDPFDDAFSMGVRNLRAQGTAVDVTVRPLPAHAPDPWLPAQSLTLTIDPPSAAPRAGEPFDIRVHEAGDGVAASQLPEIASPQIPGAQVYPEPSTTTQDVQGGTLHSERTRRFAIVPAQAGALQIPQISVPWWNVNNDTAQVARAQIPAVQVLSGIAGVTGANATTANPVAATNAPAQAPTADRVNRVLRAWQGAAVALAVVLASLLVWGWRRRQEAGERLPSSRVEPALHTADALPKLDAALALGDPALIVRVLCETAPEPRPRHLHELLSRLADPTQRDALQACEAMRWRGDGRPDAQTLVKLRAAFARGPRWATPERPDTARQPLPPLYPE